jgi:peptide chain release factor 1
VQVDARTYSLHIDDKKAHLLKQEVGGHRIQRLSGLGKKARVHSSTVMVSVLDDSGPADHPALMREPEHFVKEWYSGSGAGGQHRNKKQNSLRLRHLPTGEVVTAQCRKRPESELMAFTEMSQRLDALCAKDFSAEQSSERRAQMGSGQKADKRRTYRFQDGRVLDHLTNKKAPSAKVMKGHFELLW